MKIKIGMLWGLVAILAIGFILTDNTILSWDYVTTKRLLRLAAMAVGAICVACSAIMFQTLVGNRVLTPAIMGYEAVYLFWQSLLLLLLGTQGIAMLGISGNFIISTLLMLVYSWLLYYWLFKRIKNDVYLLLLLGLVLSMVITTFSQFIQLRISPGEFMVFQGLSFASFNRVQPETLLYAVLALLVVAIAMYKTRHVLDVMALGREQSISLGLHHAQYMRFYLALIAILVAISTSLIGPVAFMGIFIANLTYALIHSHKHSLLFVMGCAIALLLFLIAQLLVEHVFNYKTTVSILINLVCGLYFLLLMMRTRGMT
ncbi:iron chelate uptake ABC transporter family permease subunit [Acinetobacter baumannii]|uniref:Iron ABC transporter permease n=1 Tax=Acinetobacter soli TaxID=487316 RepID=A0A1P8EKT4_9GAMM|nr:MULTISPECIES: iron chelate uptake ABC transporter family permease subunit [Acinetobacter]APV36825.1 iron ABC transporter permease [Acinetobacter soli]AVP33397.1 Iron-uptake system permease protein FeuB [Acinetobacter baumannii]MDQ8999629.1 iron chelate uptake ABC transporter family permease subunit [Acinetobacter baumannii]MDQ9003070.1 iron chelate uptake ABC transporter family permease subunit [Acinetobacter baumannii]MDR9525765.1 iron chelate uptake ABC transporter family permease subunit